MSAVVFSAYGEERHMHLPVPLRPEQASNMPLGIQHAADMHYAFTHTSKPNPTQPFHCIWVPSSPHIIDSSAPGWDYARRTIHSV